MLVRDKSGRKASGRMAVLSACQRVYSHRAACGQRGDLRKQRRRKAHPAHPGYAGHYWHGHALLDHIWLEGRQYIKAGIMLDDFIPDGVSQLNFFDDRQSRKNSVQLMKMLDGINQSERGNV